MEQTQISLRPEQATRLRRLARDRGTSMAALIREAVDRVYPEDADGSLEARYRRALDAIGSGNSGLGDLAERHDDYLVEALDEDLRE